MPVNKDGIYFQIHPAQQSNTDTPKIVLIHGFFGNYKYWDSLIKSLPNCDILNIGLLGHIADSSAKQNPIKEDFKSLCKKVSTLIKDEGFINSIFIGHSMGGYIGAQIFSEKEMLFSKMIFLNSHCYLDSENQKKQRKKYLTIIPKKYSLFKSSFVKNYLQNKSLKNESLRNKILEYSNLVPLQWALFYQKSMLQRNYDFRDYNHISHMICGEYDCQNLDVLDSNKKILEHHIIPNSGHYSLWENPSHTIFKIKEICKI